MLLWSNKSEHKVKENLRDNSIEGNESQTIEIVLQIKKGITTQKTNLCSFINMRISNLPEKSIPLF